MLCFVSKYGLFEFDIMGIRYSRDKAAAIKILSFYEESLLFWKPSYLYGKYISILQITKSLDWQVDIQWDG